MILLIDNYDSFSYNLYQLIGQLDPDLHVVRNDACTVGDIKGFSRRLSCCPQVPAVRKMPASAWT